MPDNGGSVRRPRSRFNYQSKDDSNRSLSNMQIGKAFEFAVLQAIANKLDAEEVPYEIQDDHPYETAADSFQKLENAAQARYAGGANAGIGIIVPLEPMLLEREVEPLQIAIAADKRGEEGDVRDVVCSRPTLGWEVGISCKHNHEALKHPRITEGMDFGRDWMGYPCSRQFFEDMAAPMREVNRYVASGSEWKSIPSKYEDIYTPIVDAFSHEIKLICDGHKDASTRLLGYFFGVKDFYKLVMMDRERRTCLECFNMNGTLQQPSSSQAPAHKMPRINLPTRLEYISRVDDFDNESPTTLYLKFNHNWAISMRLHNADSLVKPTGLKWDVQLTGVPRESVGTEAYW